MKRDMDENRIEANKWIPVKFNQAKIMPQKDCEVWVTRRAAVGNPFVQQISYSSELGYFEWDGVTAWMPYQNEKPDPYISEKYTWKDIVYINGKVYAEEFPISGRMDDENTYQIDDFLLAVAAKYGVELDDIKTWTLDAEFINQLDFEVKDLPFGAERCGCYVDGVAEWLSIPRIDSKEEQALE